MESIRQLRDELPALGFNDYLRHMKSAEDAAADAKPLRVAVLRSYTVEPIEPVLKLRLLLDGFRPSFWFGGFNQYVQEILDPQSALYAFDPDLVLLLVRIEELMPDFVEAFAGGSAGEWQQRVAAKARELGALAERVGKACSAQVIVQGMTPPAAYFGTFDAQRADGQAQLVHAFNRELASALDTAQGIYIWDFDHLLRTKGSENLLDAKSWYVSRNPYKQSAYPAIAGDLYRYVRSAFGLIKKCVVVDLDNTLWGGIIGEDGLEGIKLGHTYPGNCYRDFQRELLKLYDRGILLAINSKNNEDEALKAIEEHPDMLLRRRHFSAIRINWQDKATNLRELARELNIGVDSLIFIDDNPVECELVRRGCPDCDVVRLPDKPYLLASVAASLARTEKVRLTAEDRQKGEMYRAQAERREQEGQYANVDDFLRSLDMEVSIEEATPFSTPRIAQLTQKTNQMNMTTRRYTEAQIAAFSADSGYGVFSVAAKDRFGDHGIIGVMILKFRADECLIDTFLLSCRVIGRGIEQAMVAFAAEQSQARRIARLVGEFLPTSKNQPAAGFYEQVGFQKTGEATLAVDLRMTTLAPPPHLSVAVRLTP